MPGFEFFGDEERKEVNDVLETGILMRYGFDGPRKGIWKSKELEAAICKTFGTGYAQLTSSGTAALTTAINDFSERMSTTSLRRINLITPLSTLGGGLNDSGGTSNKYSAW